MSEILYYLNAVVKKRLEQISKSVAILRERASEAAELDMNSLSLNEYSQVKVQHSTL